MSKEVENSFHKQQDNADFDKFGFIGKDGHGYSPVVAEQSVFKSKLVPHSKEEAREIVRIAPLIVRLIDVQMAAVDVARGTQEYWLNVRKPEFRKPQEKQQINHGLVFAGGFYSVDAMYSPLKNYFENQGCDIQFYNYRQNRYPQRKQAPRLFPAGTNIEPLEWQVEDFIDKVVDYSERLGDKVVVGGHSKGGLLTQLAMVVDSDFRKHVKFAFAIGSPIPDPQKINSTVAEQYIQWLDYFEADDFKYTTLINDQSAQMLNDTGFVSVVNRHDPIIGEGVALGKVYETDYSHCGMPFNREILNKISSHFNNKSPN